MKYEREPISKKLRFEILTRDKGRCQLCGRTPADGVKLHIDHIFPVSKGGKSVAENLMTLCQDCNLSKHDKLITLELSQKQEDALSIQIVLNAMAKKINDFNYSKTVNLIDLGYKTFRSHLIQKLKKLTAIIEEGTPFDVFLKLYTSLLVNADPIAINKYIPKKKSTTMYKRA